MARWRRLRRVGSRFLLGATLGTASGALLIWAPTLLIFLLMLLAIWYVLVNAGSRFS